MPDSSQPLARTTCQAPSAAAGLAKKPSGQAARVRKTRGPSLEKTEQTRRQIVQAALAHFLEVGISQATMARIAEGAQVAKGTLYLYFPSKDALLKGALEQAIGYSAMAQLRAERQPGESVHALMRRVLVLTWKDLETSGRSDLARLILSESLRHPSLAQMYREMFYEPWQTYVKQWLQQAIKEGELQGMSAEDGARLLGSPFWLGMAHSTLYGYQTQENAHCLDVAGLMLLQLDTLFARKA